MHIHRKLLLGAAAFMLPVSTVAVLVGTAGVASAGKPAIDAQTCTVHSTVTFPDAGLTAHGTTSPTESTSSTTTSSATLAGGGCGGGTVGGLTITSKSAKCTGAGTAASGHTTLPPGGDPAVACTSKKPKAYAVDSLAGFDTSGGTLAKSVKNLPALTSLTVGGHVYDLKAKTSSEIIPGGVCGAAEVGFAISGQAKETGHANGTFTLDACLGAALDTGVTVATDTGDGVTATSATVTDASIGATEAGLRVDSTDFAAAEAACTCSFYAKNVVAGTSFDLSLSPLANVAPPAPILALLTTDAAATVTLHDDTHVLTADFGEMQALDTHVSVQGAIIDSAEATLVIH